MFDLKLYHVYTINKNYKKKIKLLLSMLSSKQSEKFSQLISFSLT